MGKDQELIEAARNGDYNVVEKILNSRAKKGAFSSLRRGPGANAQDVNGFSALHHAALNRHKAIVELLLSHEASTNIVDLQGSSPLHLAAWSGNEEIVKLLLKPPSSGGGGGGPGTSPGIFSGTNVNLMNKSSETALHMAAQFGHTEVVKLLLHHGADSVITNERHETALDLAAQYGRFETVQLLLKAHPELLACYTTESNRQSGQLIFHHTPLHLASRNGHRAVVQVLVRSGFEVNARTSQGTALHEAALCGKVDVVKALLESGIDVCVADSQRRTAVDRLNEVGLKTPVAKEIAELIRNALKRKHILQGQSNSPLYSPYDSSSSSTPAFGSNKKDIKLPLSQIHDNCNRGGEGGSDGGSKVPRHSPHRSPKLNPSFVRGKTRRSMDVMGSSSGSVGKGPDFDKPTTIAPKKPPRRNLSASPTHPGLPDFICDHDLDLMMLTGIRNKSLDERGYSENGGGDGGWKKSGYDTSQSTESMDLSPLECPNYKPSPPSSLRVNGGGGGGGVRKDSLRLKSKSQYGDLDSSFVSVAHIKLKDAKSVQNLNVSPLALTPRDSMDDLLLDSVPIEDEDIQIQPIHPMNANFYAVIKHPKTNASGHGGATGATAGAKQEKGAKNPAPIPPLMDPKSKDLLPFPHGPKPAIAPKPKPALLPKPKNLAKRYDVATDESSSKYNNKNNNNHYPYGSSPYNSSKSSQKRPESNKSTSISTLSPVDVDKEWENISFFMDSFNGKDMEGGNGELSGMRPSHYARLSPVGKWLASIKMSDYDELLTSSGFDDVGFLGANILDENSLLEIGMLNAQHRKVVSTCASKLEVKWPAVAKRKEGGHKDSHVVMSETQVPDSVDQWLKDLHLDKYMDKFRTHFYTDPMRLTTLCNDELVTLLDMELLGHRRRMLAASAKLNNNNESVNGVGGNNSRPNSSLFFRGASGNHSGVGGRGSSSDSSRNEYKGSDENEDEEENASLPLRDPNHLVSGVSSALKTAWRHTPETLIDGSVTYKAIYVGSSQVHQFSAADAIQKAIQEIRNKEKIGIGGGGGSGAGPLLLNTQVTLVVSASIVSWYNSKTKSLIKEQDIRSIQCTCQASDDLRHVALVTRTSEPPLYEKRHSCHVFYLDSVEVATEAILTLGQAFEVAYQLALGTRTTPRENKGHTRSKSANQLSTKVTSSSSCSCSPPASASAYPSPTSYGKFSKDNSRSFVGNNVQTVSSIPPPPCSLCSNTSNSHMTQPSPPLLKKSYEPRFPRAESFSYSTPGGNAHSSSRAPIVSKEEL